MLTCVADTLNHLKDLSEWEAAFRRFQAHLKPGGRLFFDVMTCRGLESLDKFGVYEREGRILLLSIIYEPVRRRSTMKVTSFIPSRTEGLYEKATETMTEFGQPVARILECLAGRASRPSSARGRARPIPRARTAWWCWRCGADEGALRQRSSTLRSRPPRQERRFFTAYARTAPGAPTPELPWPCVTAR